MEFTLFYRGPLKQNAKPKEKQLLRAAFQEQLKLLWNEEPLRHRRNVLGERDEMSVIKTIESQKFSAIVSSRLFLVADLRIIMLRPEPLGAIITKGGDIDNRLKTLFDALSIPDANQLQSAPVEPSALDDGVFHCVLEDDKLVSGVSVETDRLLLPVNVQTEVELIIRVKTRITRHCWGNTDLV